MKRLFIAVPLLVLGLVCSVTLADIAGPAPADLKKLRLAYIDPPIKAPELRVVDLEGRQVELSEFAGKGLVLYFWASW